MSDTARQEWREGWPLLLAASMGVGLSAAPIYSLGVFMAPLHQTFGWSTAQISLAVVVTSSIVAGVSPLVGRALDRWGARRIALAGTTGLCAIQVAMAWQNGPLALFLGLWAALAIGIAFASPLVWQMAVVNRFSAKRGFALSLALCGSNFSGAVAPMICALLIAGASWRWAYAGLGIYLFITCFPLAYPFFYDARDLHRCGAARDDTASPAISARRLDEGLSISQALRSGNFWLLFLSFFLAGGSVTALIIYLVPMLTDRGLPALQAASAVSVLSIAAIGGRLAAGYFMDRVFAPYIAAVVLSMPVIACLMLALLPPTYGLALCAGAFVGFSIGSEFNMVSYLSSRYFGMRNFGVLHGLLYATFTGSSAIIPPLIGYFRGIDGNYQFSLKLMAGGFAVASAAMLFCSPYPVWEGSVSELSPVAENPWEPQI